jgi:predicted DNA-binding transcriptional regulator YafY
MFSATEALGLVMAVLDGHHDPGNESEPVGAALGKLVRALPGAIADQVQAIRRTTTPAPDRGAARPDPVTTTNLVLACSQEHRVRMRYRSEAGSEWVAKVDPWAVVVRHGRWYLLCRAESGGIRAYRLDRMREVEQLDEHFERPSDLDPVAMLEAHLAAGWEYDVEVVVDAAIETVRRRLSPALGQLESVGPDTTRLTGTTGNPYWYAEQLAVLPSPFQIIGGPELQHTVRGLGQRFLAASPSSGGESGA